MEKYAMPHHVRKHCEKVSELALSIGEKLVAKSYKLDLKNLKYACLLHDLVRVIDFKTWEPEKFAQHVSQKELTLWNKLRKKYKGRHHADVGEEILNSLGEATIARLIHAHKFENILKQNTELISWEEKLIYYADKRVKHDQIVSLEERLTDAYKRNIGKKPIPRKTQQAFEKIYFLEKEIFETIEMS